MTSLSNRPYLLCISDAGSPWIIVLALYSVAIFHLYTWITDAHGQLEHRGKLPQKICGEMIKKLFLRLWEYAITHFYTCSMCQNWLQCEFTACVCQARVSLWCLNQHGFSTGITTSSVVNVTLDVAYFHSSYDHKLACVGVETKVCISRHVPLFT